MGFLAGDVSALRAFDFTLRPLVVSFAVATVSIAVTARQNNADYGKLGFGNFVGLKYMVCISAVSGGYALFGTASSYLRCLLTKAWLFFIADQILAYLMVTSVAAQVEFLYLAYKGDQLVSWSEACGSYGKFCSSLRTVVGLHAIAVCCFLVLAVISAYRVFRRFDPPFVATKEGELVRT